AGAKEYRVYRSPVAGTPAGEERLVAVVLPASGETLTWEDPGAVAQEASPLPVGSTGVWQLLPATMSSGRQGAGVAAAFDPADAGKAYLYVMGGRDGLSPSSTALRTYEYLDLTLEAGGAQTAGTWHAGTAQLGTGRWQLGAFVASNANASRITAPSAWVYAAGGVDADGSTGVPDVDAGAVQPGGELGEGAPPSFASVKKMSPSRAGYGTAMAANFLFVFGGSGAAPSASAGQSEICGPGVGSCSSTPSPPYLVNWNTATSLSTARYLTASATESAFIFLLGGSTDTEAATTRVERTYY
ncbi:MAG: hypothetical protein HY901_29585, partial [Deltaproteobacteria bacterium]|nr:hypothetical protein [Deltaproteobacteria bacterium]